MSEARTTTARRLPLQSLPAWGRWAVLLAASALAAGLPPVGSLPAALLLGPLVAAILVQAVGGAVTIPRAFLAAAQMVIGGLVARAITAPIVTGFASHWPVFLGVVALSVAASATIG